MYIYIYIYIHVQINYIATCIIIIQYSSDARYMYIHVCIMRFTCDTCTCSVCSPHFKEDLAVLGTDLHERVEVASGWGHS